MIRKQRKAQLVYECSLCDYTSAPQSDLLRVQEAKNRHLRGNLRHLENAMREALRPFVEAVTQVAKQFETLQDAFTLAPPPNVPHDPSLRRDRRKWGGR